MGYLSTMMNDTNKKEKIEQALKRFPKAKRIAVENFTWTSNGWDMATAMNLDSDAKAYNWHPHTVAAIAWVLGVAR